MLIPDPDLDFLSIPDPEVKKGTGSRIRIRIRNMGKIPVFPNDPYKSCVRLDSFFSSVVDPYPYLDPDPDCERRAKMTNKHRKS
jgi:hypothetical protein